MTSTALITGASSGIGKALAQYHASLGGNLILTARREEALNDLKVALEAAHGITCTVVAQDLGATDGADRLYETVKASGTKVDILINNAGFGGHGQFVERDIAEEHAMIDLNVKALVTLSHRFGQDMVAQGGGKILNIGSTAGFMPGPQQAIYFATKAFVNSFSQAIDHELRDKGVTCTVLAPGYVETEFAARGNLEGTAMVTNGGKSAESVAKIGYDAMIKGKLVVINEPATSFLINWILPFLPRRMLLNMVDKTQSK